MNSFVWSPLYTVGVPDIDGQHKGLMCAMHEYYLCQSNEEHDQARGALGRLLTLTVNHFQDEEELMRQARFPHIKDHMRTHRELLHVMDGLARKYLKAPNTATAGRLCNFFRVWLTRHILGDDKKYVPYIITSEELKRAAAGR
ncbi:MAG: hemerythrin family protein [Fibrobacteres bacterium]|nr:hemerythrin family protein [Fibrobacterota bacterium]